MKKKQTEEKKRFKAINVIFWVVLAIIAIYSVVALTSEDNGTTSIFGQTAFTVQTDSMAPTFEKGDLIYVDTDFNVEDIKKDDVITYQVLLDINGDGELELVYNSHRVTKVVEDINGNLHFVTQGDNNGSEDLDPIFESHVIGVWNGKVTKNLGGIIDGAVKFLKSGVGFFLFIVLPCFAFLVYEIYKFVGVMTEYRTQEALQDRVKFQEEALAAARKQLEEEAKQKELEDKKEA